ncbi:MAG: transcriptional regulator NrdR [Zymomonas mobilis]|uniref:Transcriptional repressor NrdR n=1 Tax=Zymomonas mobilis TaxID=542 RepID=A0A542W1W9_ZYMMB|nr:transcriptional regulator NrdR [Zymomonas mobilis]TQL17576.1 transcriptional repressor NrdR [Zymomonas mobilis]
MRCPFCSCDNSQVKDSRPTEDGAAIRRRRQCDRCGARFTTFERIHMRDIVVIKKDNHRQPFDRNKLIRSVSIACRKRPISPDQIELLVNTIQHQIETSGEGEITAVRLGEMTMEGLRTLDSVAYIRFASVYKDFTEARDFEDFSRSVQSVIKAVKE